MLSASLRRRTRFTPLAPPTKSVQLTTSQYVAVGGGGAVPLRLASSEFTLEAWVYVTSYPASVPSVLCSMGAWGYKGYGFALNNGAGLIAFSMPSVITFGPSPSLNAWHHIALCRRESAIRCFVDGVQSGEMQIIGPIGMGDTATYFEIGGCVYQFGASWSTPNRYWLSGHVSNFRLCVGAALYTSNFTPEASPLMPLSSTQVLVCKDSAIKDYSQNNFAVRLSTGAAISNLAPFS